MRYLTLLCCAFAFGLMFTNTNQVHACSGGLPMEYWGLGHILTHPSETMIIAAGQVKTVSDSRRNAVLRVEKVIKGNLPNEFIVFTSDEPAVIDFALEEGRGHPARCDRLGFPIDSGEKFIAGLWRLPSGNYNGAVITENSEGLFHTFTSEDYMANIELNYEDMIAFFAETLEATPSIPQDHTMPRAAALRLHTESGDIFNLPIDEIAPDTSPSLSYQHCEAPCVTIEAPNGIDTAMFFPVESTMTEQNTIDERFRPIMVGDVGIFSTRSDLLAVWVGQELQIYFTASQVSAQSSDEPLLVSSYIFEDEYPLLPGSGAWSPDGRTFAFSTDAGVWLWDALVPNAEPTMLISTPDNAIHVRHFSPQGNYLALESVAERYNIDIRTLQEYPDGLFSTDDRILAAYDTTATELTPLVLHKMLPEFTPLGPWQNYSTMISQFEWINSFRYIYAACGEATHEPEMPPGFDKPWCKVQKSSIERPFWSEVSFPSIWVDGILFDYDPVTDSLATIVDDYTITINGEIIELEGKLESPVINIELIPVIDLDYQSF